MVRDEFIGGLENTDQVVFLISAWRVWCAGEARCGGCAGEAWRVWRVWRAWRVWRGAAQEYLVSGWYGVGTCASFQKGALGIQISCFPFIRGQERHGRGGAVLVRCWCKCGVVRER